MRSTRATDERAVGLSSVRAEPLLAIASRQVSDSTPAGEHVAAEWRKKVMHAEIMIGTQKIMGADPPPDRYEPCKGFALAVEVDQPAEADRIFNALAENGNVTMPIQQTFWSARFGMLEDQFGIPWMVNCAAAAAAQTH